MSENSTVGMLMSVIDEFKNQVHRDVLGTLAKGKKVSVEETFYGAILLAVLEQSPDTITIGLITRVEEIVKNR